MIAVGANYVIRAYSYTADLILIISTYVTCKDGLVRNDITNSKHLFVTAGLISGKAAEKLNTLIQDKTRFPIIRICSRLINTLRYVKNIVLSRRLKTIWQVSTAYSISPAAACSPSATALCYEQIILLTVGISKTRYQQ